MRYLTLLCFFPSLVFAGWVGSPSLPAIIQEGPYFSDHSFANVRVAFNGAYAFNERMKFARKERGEGFHAIKLMGSSYLGSVILNLRERVEFYLQPGMSQYKALFRKGDSYYKRTSHFGFTGKVGARGILLEVKDTTIGADVHYRYFDAFTKNKISTLYDEMHWSLREWQIGVGIGQKIRYFTPYIGVAIRQSKQRIPSYMLSPKKKLRVNQHHKKGLYMGMIVSRGAFLLIGFEGHFYHETSLTGSLQLRF